jgi:urocanate hydratase
MFYEEKPSQVIRAKKGTNIRCKSWSTEAALRMLENNIDPDVALSQEDLIVYGGSGRAARNWKCYNKIVESLLQLNNNETLLIQSGKAVGIIETFPHAPRVLIANSNIVSAWSDNFDKYDRMGLTMYGQMTAGSWIYIGTQGILQGTYETFAAIADKHFNGSLSGTITLTGGLGGMGGAQPLAIVMNGGVAIVVECREERVQQKVKEGYCNKVATSLDEAINLAIEYRDKKLPFSIGLVGNASTVFDAIAKEKKIVPDIVTDQTSAHNLLDYIPECNTAKLNEIFELCRTNPKLYAEKSRESIVKHCAAMISMLEKGSIVFDYGNNLRGAAEKGGLQVRDNSDNFKYPGFVPAYIRDLFCQGKGPFRWAALSGDKKDIDKIDEKLLELFKDDISLQKWLTMANKMVPQIGIPSRVCWLGYGDRAIAGAAINDMVASGQVKAPVVMGRDHLDTGSVASPNRETEGMKDGSDAIADWPLLNAMSNIACGADWVSIHDGGGVGVGNALHAGVVVVATGDLEKKERIKRVLTADPGLGIMRHTDAGYDIAINVAIKKNVKIPHLN